MKHFNKQILPGLAGLALCLASVTSSSIAAPVEENWQQRAEKLMSKPLTVSWQNNGATSTMNLVGVRDGQLAFKVGKQAGEASMPLDTLGDIWFDTPPHKGYSQAIGLIGKETFGIKHLNLMRQRAYPTVRFLEIPAAHCGFPDTVSNLTAGLLQLGQLDEATFLINQLDIPTLGPKFEAHAIALARALVEAGSPQKATAIIQQLPIDRIALANTALVFDLAHLLRDQKKYSDARNIYQKLGKNASIGNNPAEYWSYYCGLKEGEYLDDHSFPAAVNNIEAGGPHYPLQQLVLGIYYSTREQDQEAMRAISQGIAFATPVETWTPELMFCSAQAYATLEMPDISKSVYQETVRFFPTSPWAVAAQKELDK